MYYKFLFLLWPPKLEIGRKNNFNLAFIDILKQALNASGSSSNAQPADASVQGVDSSGDVFASELEQTDRPDEGMDVSQSMFVFSFFESSKLIWQF